MSDERPDRGQGSQQAGVLGNLPNSRPAVRSPRRNTEPPKRGAGKPQQEATGPEAAAERPPTGGGSGSSDASGDSGGSGQQPPDLEAIARTGIAVAGEAASLGLRLAGRAAAAVRDAVERR